MNIQAMLDRRITTLRQESRAADPFASDSVIASPAPAKDDKVAKSGEVLESDLTELARLVYQLTDEVGHDYARWERQMLESKLAILQKAEAALDLALTLKQRSRGTTAEQSTPVTSLAERRGLERSRA